MSNQKNSNMPGIRKMAPGAILVTKKNIKDMQPRRQIVEQRKDAEAKGQTVPK